MVCLPRLEFKCTQTFAVKQRSNLSARHDVKACTSMCNYILRSKFLIVSGIRCNVAGKRLHGVVCKSSLHLRLDTINFGPEVPINYKYSVNTSANVDHTVAGFSIGIYLQMAHYTTSRNEMPSLHTVVGGKPG